MVRASLSDVVKIERHGFKVEPYGTAWILLDPDGDSIQITGHGGVAPTKAACVAEALDRIDAGLYG
jgi:hypothetical protein